MPVPGDVDICNGESESWQCQVLASVPLSLDWCWCFTENVSIGTSCCCMEMTEVSPKGLRIERFLFIFKVSDMNKSLTDMNETSNHAAYRGDKRRDLAISRDCI